MSSRWWIHAAVLLLLALLPALLLARVVPLPAWAGNDPVPVAMVYWLGLLAHAGISSLAIKMMETRVAGTVVVHAAILGGTLGMVALAWPSR